MSGYLFTNGRYILKEQRVTSLRMLRKKENNIDLHHSITRNLLVSNK